MIENDRLKKLVILGELSLDGRVKPIRGGLSITAYLPLVAHRHSLCGQLARTRLYPSGALELRKVITSRDNSLLASKNYHILSPAPRWPIKSRV